MAQRRRKHCVLAVVRRSQKFSPRHRPPSRGHGMAKIKSAGDGHYLYLQTQFGEDRCTQFRVIVVTDPQTNKQTGPITIHCVAARTQCQYYWSQRWWRWWWQLELWDVQSSSQIITTNKPSPLELFAGRMPFMSPSQRCHSTEVRICFTVDNIALSQVK